MKTAQSRTRREFLRLGLGAGLSGIVLARCGAGLEGSLGLADAGTTTDAGGATSTDAGTASNACVLDPTTTKGPYWIDEKLNRSDVRSDTHNLASPNPRPGLPLALDIAVSAYASGACTPPANAQVDIWHCDATGNYSDVGSTSGQNFLRGHQVTDASGVARFTTIYPGWYSGRAVHIHVKVRIFDASSNTTSEATTQIFFDDAVTDAVFAAVSPYSRRPARDTRNANDNIYDDQTVLLVHPSGDPVSGMSATFSIGMQVGQINPG